MRLLLWVLDVNGETRNGAPEMHLWGLDDKGHRVLLVDRSFKPRFYLVLDDGADEEKVAEEVRKLQLPKVAAVSVAHDKKLFGRHVKALKITCDDPALTTKYAASLAKLAGVKEHLEDDLRYSQLYLVEKSVNPCGWHMVEAEKIDAPDAAVDAAYLAKTSPKALDKTDVPSLRILAFSAVYHSHKGSPKPEKNPAVIISTATSSGEERQFIADEEDDKASVEDFIRYVQTCDPDVIAGYGSNSLDWPYLLERAKRAGLRLLVDRRGGEPHRSVYGHMSITGRANLDVHDFADEITEVRVKTLENIADFLGVAKPEDRLTVEDVSVSSYWEDRAKRPTLLKFSARRTQDILATSQAMLDFAEQLSNLVGIPLDHVGTAAVGFRIESYLIRQAYKLGELVPPRVEQPYFPYQGAIVMAPKPGLHEKVDALDFKAMYPSIMIANNISPDTYVGPGMPAPPSGVYEAPEVKHRFRKEPDGLYRKVLCDLIAHRDEVRARLRKLSPKESEFKLLDERQRAVKTITNAAYGYAGWIGARWYVRPVAEAAAAWGRYTITRAMELAEKEAGLELIYSDTDSIFVKHDAARVEEFTRLIQRELGLEIRPDKFYVRILFTEAKKRYAGLLPNGELDIVGLEVARGDWTGAAKEAQRKVLEIVLEENSPRKAVEFVKDYIRRIRSKEVPYRDLVIWKALTRAPSEYKVNAPHVVAAKLLAKEGWELNAGDEIGFVITKGKGRLFERARPYALSSYDDIDLEYYVTQQIIPATYRVLSIFNIAEDDLKPN